MRPIKGHALLYEGRVWDSGYVRNGTGHARCECGGRSPELPTTAARQRWHREHKARVSGITATVRRRLGGGDLLAEIDRAEKARRRNNP